MRPFVLSALDVKAILAGRKTAHCMLLKPQPEFKHGEYGHPEELDDGHWCMQIDGNKPLDLNYSTIFDFDFTPPFYSGDEVYIKEPWFQDPYRYLYKADYRASEKFYRNDKEFKVPWKSGITMPKEIARLFVKITNVQLIHIQDITEEDAYRLGIVKFRNRLDLGEYGVMNNDYWVVDPETQKDLAHSVCWTESARQAYFWGVWNAKLSTKDYQNFMWQTNPYVWKIEFERIEKSD